MTCHSEYIGRLRAEAAGANERLRKAVVENLVANGAIPHGRKLYDRAGNMIFDGEAGFLVDMPAEDLDRLCTLLGAQRKLEADRTDLLAKRGITVAHSIYHTLSEDGRIVTNAMVVDMEPEEFANFLDPLAKDVQRYRAWIDRMLRVRPETMASPTVKHAVKRMVLQIQEAADAFIRST